VRKIVITGPPAAGKTTLAAALGARLDAPHWDTDAEVEREAGRTVPELFASEGEPGFRQRERRALLTLLEREGPAVIAVGGGTLLDTGLRRDVLKRALVVGLTAPAPALQARAQAHGVARPLLQGDAKAKLTALLDARAEIYAEAHAHLDAARAPEAVAEHAASTVRALGERPPLVVPLGARTYRVHFGPLAGLGALVAGLSPSLTLLVTDATVQKALKLQRSKAGLKPIASVVLPGTGERAKTLSSVERIWNAALTAALDRDALIAAVGGGVVTDLAGFAAATLLRGVRCVSAPTTLLAMVDASVGGKTGFDHPRGKNLIGAFHQPSAVLCDPEALRTLSARARRAGLAEVVKIALVRDLALLEALERDADRLAQLDLSALAAVISPAIQAKIDVVAADEREAGLRALLNFGHTVGHSIERAAKFRLPHGECVALGMRAALELGARLAVTPPALAARAFTLLDRLKMPARPPKNVTRRQILDGLDLDKKRSAGRLRFVLCDAPGSGTLAPVDKGDVEAVLEALWGKT
jgi:shikimate kinase/3-dehydroquinate synthase